MFDVRFITSASVSLACCMALTPAVFTAGPYLESRYFPVVRDTRLLEETAVDGGVSFFVRFRKVRQCEFLGLVWYVGDVRVPVNFAPSARNAPPTRPTGPQYAGPWLVQGTPSTKGNRAYAYHRCHPLWVTISGFYES